MGRKAKYTVAQMIAALRQTKGMVYLAADVIGCHADTVYEFAKRHPSVQEAIDHEREKILDIAEISLAKKIMDGDDGMIRFILQTRGKKRGYTTGHEVSGPEGGPLVIRVIYGADGTSGKTASETD
jgi:hypothetical protein